ncbi:MAG: YmdB family metallophosphoesterase [Gemmataceae bacterium]
MRILFIGDIVGRPGLTAVKTAVPKLRSERSVDVVIANAENVTNGSGCLPSAYRQLREAGVDLVTLGDHCFKKSDIIELMASEERLCRPANFPAAAPGREFATFTMPDGQKIVAICVLGRTFMRPADCPFAALDRLLEQFKNSIVIVDAHAEATAEKYLLGHHLKGRVAAVLGTHTHVPTADEQILPGGTAFICDVGMTGPYDGILGRKVEPVLKHALTFEPTTFDVADGDVRLGGAIVDVDDTSKRATAIERVRIDVTN